MSEKHVSGPALWDDLAPGTVVSPDPARSAAAVRREIIRLAWPAVVEMLLHMGIWMADVVMVGRLGASALGAVGVAGQIYWTLVPLCGSVGVALTAMVARRVGAGRSDEAAEVAGQGLTLAVAGGLLLAAGLWAGAPALFGLTELDAGTAALGVVYLRTVCLNAPLVVGGMALAGVVRAFGDTRTPMLVTVFANVLNVLAGYSLIFGKLGLPALGVRGSALAAVVAQSLGPLLLAGLVASGRVRARVAWRRFGRPERRTAGRILRLALPAGLESMFVEGARMVGVLAISSLGALAVAGHEVTAVTESLSFMPGYGFAVAASILVGQS
ncbi:MAG: MATE family efflux transporter, partial [Firmicutes bacterium]|nr:MATE family efflux transporter [Bacillota bacterium]